MLVIKKRSNIRTSQAATSYFMLPERKVTIHLLFLFNRRVKAEEKIKSWIF